MMYVSAVINSTDNAIDKDALTLIIETYARTSLILPFSESGLSKIKIQFFNTSNNIQFLYFKYHFLPAPDSFASY